MAFRYLLDSTANQKSMVKHFLQRQLNNFQLLTILAKKAQSQMFKWVLNRLSAYLEHSQMSIMEHFFKNI